MKITVMTGDEQILTLDVDRDETVENLKALLEVEMRVPLQQQQLLFNGKEMRNPDKMSALGVGDGDLVMMVANAAPSRGSQSELAMNPDGSAVNPSAFQQQIRNDSNTMAQLFQRDPELAQVILGNDLNKLQDVLRARNRQRSELNRRQEEEMALLHADPFDIEAQKKIEEAIRQKGIDENWEAALEHNPEAFARVVMLYVDMEVNGVPLKVDAGDYIMREQANVDDASSARTHPTTNVIEMATVVSSDIESVENLKISLLKRKLERMDIKTGSPMKEALFQSTAECTSVEPTSVPACEETAQRNCPPP